MIDTYDEGWTDDALVNSLGTLGINTSPDDLSDEEPAYASLLQVQILAANQPALALLGNGSQINIVDPKTMSRLGLSARACKRRGTRLAGGVKGPVLDKFVAVRSSHHNHVYRQAMCFVAPLSGHDLLLGLPIFNDNHILKGGGRI